MAVCAAIPAATPAWDVLDKAVRSSTILGLVRAGDIGIELGVSFELPDHPTAMTVVPTIGAAIIGI